ncbi:hypothetical protein D9758_013285 [Tetrapyrgos nigripes]|uniref:Nephrocystin 3-like N-terminal domain-containing protein n=1 Tax=Tetrapyrgos nigripes TaxID=182062 RepID=A0A8H5FPH1_9AGAR|nr:hypothetical protein D9758_013285 [Tetrapyrgos nigripes]
MNTNLFSGARSPHFGSHTDFNVVHGNQTNIRNYMAPSAAESGLQRLYEIISEVGALHDDDARFPPPKCHPDTRKAILDELTIWAGPPSASDQSIWDKLRLARAATSFLRSSNTICWLYGPAGVGKSAIAQTLCERLHGENLAASFFFSRNSPTRDNPKYLFLTIAYCLATYSNNSKLRSAIDNAVKKRPGVLKSSIVTQFHELIVNPLRSLPWWRKRGLPRLVVIDGLDECTGADAQRLVLETITGSAGDMLTSIPLRFLITSRPEHAIREVFNRPPLLSCAKRTILDDIADTARDIELYLRDGFQRIREVNSDISFPSEWPESGVLDELVMRASGQFIYASTVLKYVGDRDSYPPDRLQVVFNLPIGDAGAFADLDILYHEILASNPQGSFVVQVLALVLLTSSRSNLEILEQVYSLPKAAMTLTLRGLHSVLNVSSNSVAIYHKSFVDFLLDQRRSKEYFIDLDAHRGLLLDHLGKIFARQNAASQSTSLDRATMIDRVNGWDSLFDAPDECFRVLLERFGTMNFLLVLGTFLCLRSIGKEAVSILLLEDLLSGSGAVSDILQSFNCVLESRSAKHINIRLSSFEDFLLDSERSHEFFIDLSLFHTGLASYCLKAVHDIPSCEEGPGIDLSKMNPSQLYAMNHALEHLRRAKMAEELIYQVEGDAGAFPDLDILYHKILASNPQGSLVIQVLALVFLTSSRSNLEILEEVFSLPKEAIALTLRGLHSVLSVSSNSVAIYHKSFVDFLLDQRRSKEYFIDLDAHRGLLLDHVGEILAIQDAASQSTSPDRAIMIDRVNRWDRLVDAPDDCFRVLLKRFDTMNFLGTFLCLQSSGKEAVSIALLEDLLSWPGAVSDILQSLNHEEGPGINLSKMNPNQLYAITHVLEHLRRATMREDLIYQAKCFDLDVIKYLKWKLPRVTVVDPRPGDVEGQLFAWAKALHANIHSLLTIFQAKEWGDIRAGPHRNIRVLLENLADGIYIAPISDGNALLDLERLLTYQVSLSEISLLFNYKQLTRLVGVVSNIVLIHPDEIVTKRLDDFRNRPTTIPQLQAHFIDFRRGNASWAVICMEKIMTRDSRYSISDRYAKMNCFRHLVEASRTGELISKLNELLVFLQRWGGRCLTQTIIDLDLGQLLQLIHWLNSRRDQGFPEPLQPEVDRANSLLQELFALSFNRLDCYPS